MAYYRSTKQEQRTLLTKNNHWIGTGTRCTREEMNNPITVANTLVMTEYLQEYVDTGLRLVARNMSHAPL